MESIVNCLLKTKLFDGMLIEDVETLLPLLHVQIKRLDKGAVLVSMYEKIDYIGAVSKGELSIFKEDIYGHPNLIRKVKVNRLYGIEVACTPSQMSPLVITSDTDSEVITFPYHLISQPGTIPDKARCLILKNILELLANANMRQLYKIDILSKKSLRDRILLYLSLQSRRKKTNEILIPFNREEFASYLCVDRSALSRELSRMQKEGLLEYDKNSFKLLTQFTDRENT